MKTLLITLGAVILIGLSSCSKNGIHLSNADLVSDNYWENQSKKIVHRNQRYAKMEERYSNKEERVKDKREKIAVKQKKRNKQIAAAQPFKFH